MRKRKYGNVERDTETQVKQQSLAGKKDGEQRLIRDEGLEGLLAIEGCR